MNNSCFLFMSLCVVVSFFSRALPGSRGTAGGAGDSAHSGSAGDGGGDGGGRGLAILSSWQEGRLCFNKIVVNLAPSVA